MNVFKMKITEYFSYIPVQRYCVNGMFVRLQRLHLIKTSVSVKMAYYKYYSCVTDISHASFSLS